MSEDRCTFTAKVKKFMRMPFPNKLNALHHLWRQFIGVVYYRRIFASFGSGSVLYKPMLLSNTQYIHIGKNVLIRDGARLEAVIIHSESPPSLYIEDNVTIEQDAHIVFAGKVVLHAGSGLAPRCTLLCVAHPFLDIYNPVEIRNRLTGCKSVIEIGAGSLIGAGCVIQMNVRIGKYVVVGSNSVIKASIPEYSVVDGNPAVVGMRYDKEQERWITVGDKKKIL